MPYRIDLPVLDARGFDRLIDLGALDIEATASGSAAIMPDGVVPDHVAGVLGVAPIAIGPVAERDAGSVWVLRPRPVHVRGLRILPADHEPEPGAIRLADAPAFGTGLHPTTVLCLEALDDAVKQNRPRAVLDVGTGSGVLALAALRLGVPRVVGLDVDPEAVRTAAANAQLNALAARLHLVLGGPSAVRGAWPLAVANLLTGPLLEVAPDLVRRVGPRGQLVLSGIRSSTERDVADAYRRWGMERLTASTRDGWAALLLQASW
jgi:ribosomal protein L11 methyltransferase